MRKKPFDYFEAYRKQAHYAQEMVLNLASALDAGELGTRSLMEALHTVENDADAVNHAIQEHLLSDFVVPLDRSGMEALAHALDDVCDRVEQVAIDSYTRKMELAASQLPRGFADQMQLLKDGAQSLVAAVELLELLDKRRADIKGLCVQIQSAESQADGIYISSVRALYEDESLAGERRRVRQDLFDAVENAMDAMEDVAECLESLMVASA